MKNILGSSKLLLALLFCLSILVSGPDPARALLLPTNSAYLWSIQTVEKSQGGYKFSLKLDASDGPHIAFGRGHLYYASLEGDQWITQTVDNTRGSGNNLSLALDSSGDAHIAYEANSYGPAGLSANIRYAYWNSSQWMIQTISASAPTVGLAMALDSFDHPHIVFADPSQTLKYATWTGTQWSLQTIETMGPDTCQRMPPSIVLSADGTPHIAYGCGALRYATRINNVWHIQALDSDISYDNTSISLDGSGHPHIAYQVSGEIRYVAWNGAEWTAPQVVGQGSGPSLVIDALDQPHVSYGEGFGGNAVKEATSNGGTWTSQTIAGPASGCETSQALDGEGKLHLAYDLCSASAPLFDFYYVYQDTDASNWSVPQLIQSSTWLGWSASIAVDQNNHPHISYLDRNQRTLRYATWDGSQWVSQLIDNGVDLHVYSSIKVDHNNVPHIAYFGFGGLTYASPDESGGWSRESLAIGGAYASLALDPVSDAPRIAFCSGGLKYAAWNGISWDVESVDSVCGGSDVGGETSLALDSNGDPHITYSEDGHPLPLPTLYITRQGGSWSTQSLVAENAPSGRTLSLDSSDTPHIAFCGGSSMLPQYATWNGSNWDIATIENLHPLASLTCQTIFLAIDNNDVAHVAYLDYVDGSLRYLESAGSAWVGYTVASDLNTLAQYSPVAVGPNGAPWIAYSDLLAGDLIAALRIPAPVFSVTPSSWLYGVVMVRGASATKTFIVNNTGSGDLTFSGDVALTGTNPGQFNITAGSCLATTTLHTGQTCTVTVAFKPTSAGSKSAALRFLDNDPGYPHTIELSGKGGIELALNGGFNTFTGTSKIPSSWVATQLATNDGKDTVTKKEGTASFRINGQAGKTKTLTQTKTLSGGTGNTFLLSLWTKGMNIPTTVGVVRAQVLFYNGSTLKQVVTMTIPNGSNGWTQQTKTFASSYPYTRIVVKLTYSKSGGKVWFDGLSLLRSP